MSVPPPSDDYSGMVHYLWEAALSLLGGVFVRRWNRLEDRVEKKADKEELEDMRQDIREEIREWKREQQQQHTENRTRLDRIWEKLNNE